MSLAGLGRRSLQHARGALCALLIVSAGGAALFAQSTDAPQQAVGLAQFSEALEDLSERVGQTVVQIFAAAYVPREGRLPPSEQLLPTLRSLGSGVILESNGYIVTNAHIVQDAARIQVELARTMDADGERRSILRGRGRILGAQVVGTDQETDLAVLKVAEDGLPFLPLGDSDEVRMGQVVLAFGSSLGLENSVTMGVVSAVARQLRPEDPMIYIQTDASINPGNSGGPLVDTQGRVVGLNTAILSQSGGNEGIGFAVPSNIVRNVYEQIRATGKVRRGELGVNAQTITPSLAAGLGLARDWGVVLSDVSPGSSAARAGLAVGDVIVALDGKQMENARQFQVNLYRRAVGDTVRLEMLRGDAQLTFFAAVTDRPGDPDRFQGLVRPERHLIAELGVLGLDLDAEVLAMLPPLRRRVGVLVAATVEGALATRDGGFLPGGVIHAVNGRDISGLAELRQVLSTLTSGTPVAAHVERGSRLTFVAFTME